MNSAQGWSARLIPEGRLKFRHSSTIAGQHLADRKLVPIFKTEKSITVKARFAMFPERHAKRPRWLRFSNGCAGKRQVNVVAWTFKSISVPYCGTVVREVWARNMGDNR